MCVILCMFQLTDSSMELLTGRCPQLETLDISHCSTLTGATLRSITQVGGGAEGCRRERDTRGALCEKQIINQYGIN